MLAGRDGYGEATGGRAQGRGVGEGRAGGWRGMASGEADRAKGRT